MTHSPTVTIGLATSRGLFTLDRVYPGGVSVRQCRHPSDNPQYATLYVTVDRVTLRRNLYLPKGIRAGEIPVEEA